MSLDLYLSNECKSCGHEDDICFNITHNLGPMAIAVDVYECLWHPEENGYTTASQIISKLSKGIAEMQGSPELFKLHDSPNGWGTYKQFLPWLEKLLAVCVSHPNYLIKAST